MARAPDTLPKTPVPAQAGTAVREPAPDSAGTRSAKARTFAEPAVRAPPVPEKAERKSGTTAPLVDNLVPSWQPARLFMETLIVLAIVVAGMLLFSAGLMVVHRLYHFFASGGWRKSPVEISELGVAGVFTLKQTQSDQQKSDRVRDTEIVALNDRVDAAVTSHDALADSITGVYGMLEELSARVDRIDAGPPRAGRRRGSERGHARS